MNKKYCEQKEAALWHAFNTLDDKGINQVPKSQLKVLSHNLGSAYGAHRLENRLDDTIDQENLSFEKFSTFLKQHLFGASDDSSLRPPSTASNQSHSPVPRKRSNSSAAVQTDKFSDICWMLCSKVYISREDNFTDKSVKHLWEIFCFLSERDGDKNLLLPVCMDHEEIEFVCQKYIEITGQNVRTIEQTITNKDETADFPSFLQTFSANCLNGMTSSDVDVGVLDLHEMFTNDRIKKGVLMKKGNVKYTQWKERLFILTPQRLNYYDTKHKLESKGEIMISPSHKTEGLSDRPGAKCHRFSYTVDNRVYEMSAPDLRTKNEWISALRTAIANCEMETSYQRHACETRREKREEIRTNKRSEEQAKLVENEMIKKRIAEIEAEKEARGLAMEKLKEEMEIRDAEQNRLQELANQRRQELENERLERDESELRKLTEAEQKLKDLESKMASDIKFEKQLREQSELRMQTEAEQKLKDLESKMTSDIELEKQAREEAENKLITEEALRVAEEARLKELQELNDRLKTLLLEEQEARKDEVIVRTLQARILDEEFEKREALEKLQEEMLAEFEAEKQKSEDLEMEKKRQEEMLSQAMEQQKQLEMERAEAQAKIDLATKKLQAAERRRVEMESEIRKRAAPIGLARPIPVEARPLLTHRGAGAFVDADFIKRS